MTRLGRGSRVRHPLLDVELLVDGYVVDVLGLVAFLLFR